MNHIDLLKSAFQITWRYRPLWIFGFLLALCSGGGGGGGNFNFPSTGSSGDFGDFEDIPNFPSIDFDTNLIIALGVGLLCLIFLLVVVGVVVRVVARTALIGMVRQITETEAITVTDGWQFGWSKRAWRLFLVGLLIGIPVAVVSVLLILLALSPLLLLIFGETATTVVGVVLAVLGVLFMIFVLLLISLIVSPIQELAWRRTALEERGVIESLGDVFGLVKRRFKDVAIVWLLLFGIGIAWGIVSLLVVLPISLIAALLFGGIPAGLVYLVSRSGLGAAVTGIPLALFIIILINTVASGYYLVYRSSVWTLAYLEIRGISAEDEPPTEASSPVPLTPEPQPQE